MPTAHQSISMEIRAREDETRRLTDEAHELQDRCEAIRARQAELRSQIDALKTALAIVQEQSTPEPPVIETPVVEPVAEPDRTPEQERVRREILDGAEARHAADAQAKKVEAERAAKNAPRKGLSKDGLSIKHIAGVERPAGTGKGSKRPKRYLSPATLRENPSLRWDKLTDLERQRTELVMMILEDGPASQYELGQQVIELIDGCEDMQQAASIVSAVIKIMQVNNLVIWTGELVQGSDLRRRSPVWKLARQASPDERAAAGLPISDDNYAGTTTRWPVGGQQPGRGTRITMESSQFEGKR